MKLKNFVKELGKISKKTNPNRTEVLMADYIPVVRPILKDNIVFITDIDPKTPND